jgi:thioredoxin-related protein
MTFLIRACTAGLLLAIAITSGPATAAEVRDPDAFFTLNMGDLRADLAEARAEGRQALLVMFEQEGCPGCAYMRRHVLSRGDVQDYYRKHFINLSLNIHGAVPLKDTLGRDATEKSHAQSAKIRATPTFVFYGLNGAEIARFVGPMETAEEFILLGQFVATGAYKKSTFAQYRARKSKGG